MKDFLLTYIGQLPVRYSNELHCWFLCQPHLRISPCDSLWISPHLYFTFLSETWNSLKHNLLDFTWSFTVILRQIHYQLLFSLACDLTAGLQLTDATLVYVRHTRKSTVNLKDEKVVEGISEFDTKCKALIFVKLKQQSRFWYKKFLQRLNQQCKSDFWWISTVKWPL